MAGTDLTTLHVARARAGDLDSIAWLVERFTPLLLIQARHRLGARLLRRTSPEDVVQEAWAIALPRLATLEERDGRATPVVLRFLGTVVLRLVNNALRRVVNDEVDAEPSAFAALAEATKGPLTRAMRLECNARVTAAIDALEERDRALVVLRAIEQRDNAEAAAELGLAPNTAAQAYRRALEKLRGELGPSAFDELAARE